MRWRSSKSRPSRLRLPAAAGPSRRSTSSARGNTASGGPKTSTSASRFLKGLSKVGKVAAKVWRGESGLDGNAPPEWWFLGASTWRGNARAYVATAPFLFLVLLGAGIAEWSGDEDTGMALGSVSLAAGLLVNVAIVLFNRPRALVPPHLRSEPGALAERRMRKRRLES